MSLDDWLEDLWHSDKKVISDYIKIKLSRYIKESNLIEIYNTKKLYCLRFSLGKIYIPKKADIGFIKNLNQEIYAALLKNKN